MSALGRYTRMEFDEVPTRISSQHRRDGVLALLACVSGIASISVIVLAGLKAGAPILPATDRAPLLSIGIFLIALIAGAGISSALHDRRR